jgi:hypothetical protein
LVKVKNFEFGVMRPILKGTATVCLLLTLWSAVAAVAHHQPAQPTH